MRLMVTFERPSSEELVHYKRSEKYKILKENSSRLRKALLGWIKEHNLSDEVKEVGYPSAFNVLFVTGTPKAAQELAKAPGVASVGVSPDFRVDLLESPNKTDSY
jgi:glutamate-1-semialdehyde aminotransferase